MNEVEELGHDRRDASEKVGSAGAFHLMTVPLDLDECALLQGDVLVYPRGIHVPDPRQENSRGCTDVARDCYLLLCQLFEIARKRAWISAQVFVRSKLGRVDKDGDDRQIVFLERPAN